MSHQEGGSSISSNNNGAEAIINQNAAGQGEGETSNEGSTEKRYMPINKILSGMEDSMDEDLKNEMKKSKQEDEKSKEQFISSIDQLRTQDIGSIISFAEEHKLYSAEEINTMIQNNDDVYDKLKTKYEESLTPKSNDGFDLSALSGDLLDLEKMFEGGKNNNDDQEKDNSGQDNDKEKITKEEYDQKIAILSKELTEAQSAEQQKDLMLQEKDKKIEVAKKTISDLAESVAKLQNEVDIKSLQHQAPKYTDPLLRLGESHFKKMQESYKNGKTEEYAEQALGLAKFFAESLSSRFNIPYEGILDINALEKSISNNKVEEKTNDIDLSKYTTNSLLEKKREEEEAEKNKGSNILNDILERA